jgi:membrane-bound metal-dependent hydrolase YbcI (DUF457 family)
MFILGHVGIATGAAHSVSPRADLRVVAFAALLPDIVDKSCALLIPSFMNGWTRGVAHSVTGAAIFALVAILKWRSAALPVILGYVSHLVLDRMWEEPRILYWPFEGIWFPPYPFDHVELWWQKVSDVWTIAGEVIGATIVASFLVRARLREPERRRAFLATGRIPEPADTVSS